MSSPKSPGRAAAWTLLVLCGGASWSLSVAHALHQPGTEVTMSWAGILVGTLPVICVAILSHMASSGHADRVDRLLVWGVMLLSMVMSLSAQAATVDPYMDWILHWAFPVMSDVATVVGLRTLMRRGASVVPAEVAPAIPEAVPVVPVLPEVVPAEVVPAEVVPAEVVPAEVVPAEVVPAEVVPDEAGTGTTPGGTTPLVPVPLRLVPAPRPVPGTSELEARGIRLYRESLRPGSTPLSERELAAELGQKSRRLANKVITNVRADMALEGAQNA
jgi:hypothetical protein